MTVLVNVNTAKQVGDAEHLKAFATVEAAEIWFKGVPDGVDVSLLGSNLGPSSEAFGGKER